MSITSELLGQYHAGGFVLIPIILTGLVMWWLILNKLCKLVQFRKHERSLQELQTNPPPEWHWQHSLQQDFVKLRCRDDEVNHALMSALGNTCCESMAKGVSTIALLAAAAPLLGLLGTVTGMISTFTIIAEFGTGNARGLAEGISQALITTQGGLLVAIPGYIAVNMLQRRISSLQQRIDLFLTHLDEQPRGEAHDIQNSSELSLRSSIHG